MINVQGRYFTGLGSPVDVMLRDISEGGCSFPAGQQKVVIGSPIQVYIAGSGPHRGSVRWVEDGQVGVIFTQPLPPEQVEQFQGSHVPDKSAEATPGEFEPMPDVRPQRFC